MNKMDKKERPLGIKIAVACEIIITLLIFYSFVIVKNEWEIAKNAIPTFTGSGEIEIGGRVSEPNKSVNATLETMIYFILAIGLLHLIPIFLIWKGNNLARYVVILFAIFDIFAVPNFQKDVVGRNVPDFFMFVSIVISIIILYFIWFNPKTKEFFK